MDNQKIIIEIIKYCLLDLASKSIIKIHDLSNINQRLEEDTD